MVRFDRAAALARQEREEFDILVIGGGITGAGCALDAASRGLRTALVERDDFASGTSSRSSKLIHGGLRYLEHGELGLVYEALAERRRLLRNAPHLVRPQTWLIPIFTGPDGRFPHRLATVIDGALWTYDVGGGMRIGHRHRRVGARAAAELVPGLEPGRLAGGFLYEDAWADDARLTLAVAQTAARRGAAVANHARVTGFTSHRGRLTGAVVETGGGSFILRARVIVNATGVWAGDLLQLAEGRHPDLLRPARGVHIAVPWKLVGNRVSVTMPVPEDRRSVFIVRWGDAAYIGTTDTDHQGGLDDPAPGHDDIDYLLRAVNRWLERRLGTEDVLGAWAGLRPLVRTAGGARTADLSRRHRVTRSPGGLITVTGGKLTTYRVMAADAVDAACAELGSPAPCRTRDLPLAGAGPVAPGTSAHLAERYGAAAGDVTALIAARPDLALPLVPGLPYLRAEAVYAVRHEMALTLDDVLSRRTRARLLNAAATEAAAPAVAALIGPELGWDAARMVSEVERYRRRSRQDLAAAGRLSA